MLDRALGIRPDASPEDNVRSLQAYLDKANPDGDKLRMNIENVQKSWIENSVPWDSKLAVSILAAILIMKVLECAMERTADRRWRVRYHDLPPLRDPGTPSPARVGTKGGRACFNKRSGNESWRKKIDVFSLRRRSNHG